MTENKRTYTLASVSTPRDQWAVGLPMHVVEQLYIRVDEEGLSGEVFVHWHDLDRGARLPSARIVAFDDAWAVLELILPVIARFDVHRQAAAHRRPQSITPDALMVVLDEMGFTPSEDHGMLDARQAEDDARLEADQAAYAELRRRRPDWFDRRSEWSEADRMVSRTRERPE